MRIRTIKPDFFKDDEIAALEPLTRLLFVGLWGLADCSGRFADKPSRIKVEVLPFDSVDVDAALNDLAQHGFIKRYTVDEKGYIEIRNFRKHQRISGKESQYESDIPPPPRGPREAPGKQSGSTGEAPGKQQGSNRENKTFQEGKGNRKEIEGKGKEIEKTPPASAAAKPRSKNSWSLWVDARRALKRGDPVPVGRSTSACKNLFEALGRDADRFNAVIYAYLADEDAFFVRNGHAIEMLKPDRYANAPPAPKREYFDDLTEDQKKDLWKTDEDGSENRNGNNLDDGTGNQNSESEPPAAAG